MGNEVVEDLRYLEKKDHFLDLVFSVFEKYFNNDRKAFEKYFEAIPDDALKNLFLRIGSFYKYLVKDGKFTFSDQKLDFGMAYINESYKYMAIFSLIEALYEKDQYIDFYQYLVRKKTKLKYPIENRNELDSLYEDYKKEFGAIRNAIQFFERLDANTSQMLMRKLKIKDKEASIKELANALYYMRSEFVHAAKFILSFGKIITVSRVGKKLLINDLSLAGLEHIFEQGFLEHFKPAT